MLKKAELTLINMTLKTRKVSTTPPPVLCSIAWETIIAQCRGKEQSFITRRAFNQTCLEAVLHAGARMASRANLRNERFGAAESDLSEAEAVMDLIQAKNQFSMQASIKQLRIGRREESEEPACGSYMKLHLSNPR